MSHSLMMVKPPKLLAWRHGTLPLLAFSPSFKKQKAFKSFGSCMAAYVIDLYMYSIYQSLIVKQRLYIWKTKSTTHKTATATTTNATSKNKKKSISFSTTRTPRMHCTRTLYSISQACLSVCLSQKASHPSWHQMETDNHVWLILITI